MDEFLEQSARSLEQGSSSQPQPEQGVGQSHDPEDGDHDDDDDDDEEEGRLVIAQETEEEENTATPRLPTATLPQRSPPPLIKHESPSRLEQSNSLSWICTISCISMQYHNRFTTKASI